MFIDFQPPDAWLELNQSAGELFSVNKNGGLARVVPGIAAALVETGVALVKQFPHKKKVLILRGFDPTLEALASALSRESCSLQSLDWHSIHDVAQLEQSITMDHLMVVVSEDDPLLGQLIDTSVIEKICEQRKVYCLRLSHAHHRYLPLVANFSRYIVHLQSISSDLAVVLTSDKLKLPVQFADSVRLNQNAMEQIKTAVAREFINPAVIQKWESSLPAQGHAVFKPDQKRLMDRSVIFWSDLDGYAVMTQLMQELGINDRSQSRGALLETTSLHRWRGVRTMDWLRHHHFTDEMIRGTLIIDHSLIDDRLRKALEKVCAEIRQIQNGD